MDERLPLVFIDREGKPGGGEGTPDKQGPVLHLERTETESVGLGEL